MLGGLLQQSFRVRDSWTAEMRTDFDWNARRRARERVWRAQRHRERVVRPDDPSVRTTAHA
jgi:hypothetical protein